MREVEGEEEEEGENINHRVSISCSGFFIIPQGTVLQQDAAHRAEKEKKEEPDIFKPALMMTVMFSGRKCCFIASNILKLKMTKRKMCFLPQTQEQIYMIMKEGEEMELWWMETWCLSDEA